ncbi:MAG: bifunctional phosphoribosylaminoimidazolecarboxamide formyltransferase/IMP cyclohydrolase [Candidatus Krumholzibacteriia bacterium]
MKSNPIKTAILSVTDKAHLLELAGVLKNRGVRILASSGTQKHLAAEGIEAEEISSYTGSKELLDGRVKTLHPKIHAGILANRGIAAHNAQLREEGIDPIDLVVVNLYPFTEKYRGGNLDEQEMCEFIDIGGITLLRAAAKNFHHVTVVTDPADYEVVGNEIEATGATSLETRRRLARDAFSVTGGYDAAIGAFFDGNLGAAGTPARINLALEKVADLRYGENPHQAGAVYRTLERSAVISMEKHQGKELSFNNYLDLVGAFAIARDLGAGSVAIIKHTNPCGAAWCGDVALSYRRALRTDPVSAFGGIVAVNGRVDGELAGELKQLFLEVVVAREFGEGALEVLAKKKNLRVVTVPEAFWQEPAGGRFGLLTEGFYLAQDADAGFPELKAPEAVTKRGPSREESRAMHMAWIVAKHVKSNAIVIADHEGTVGIGAGQMSRVDSSHIAARKAGDADFSLAGKVAASDAFFPFADGVTTLASAGITAVIQPGGSIRDKEVIDAANEAGVAMLFTRRRHFRHI